MGKYTKTDILEKARELAKMIAETEEVEFFKRAEAKIHENKKVKEKISQLKLLQKQAVNLQNYGKVNALKLVEEKIERIEKELDDIPVVQEFKESQYEVNELLQIVSNTIANTVTKNIIESTGGDLLGGKTGAELESEKG
jgi:Protein of unknown function (DUF964).